MTIDTIMNPRTPSAEQARAAMAVVMAVAETIRESGSCPSGVIYSALIGRVSLGGYQQIIARLKGAGLVSESGDLLTWIGPTLEGK